MSTNLCTLPYQYYVVWLCIQLFCYFYRLVYLSGLICQEHACPNLLLQCKAACRTVWHRPRDSCIIWKVGSLFMCIILHPLRVVFPDRFSRLVPKGHQRCLIVVNVKRKVEAAFVASQCMLPDSHSSRSLPRHFGGTVPACRLFGGDMD